MVENLTPPTPPTPQEKDLEEGKDPKQHEMTRKDVLLEILEHEMARKVGAEKGWGEKGHQLQHSPGLVDAQWNS